VNTHAAENAHIAAQLRQAADVLESQGANPFRVSAYRRAGDSVEQLGRSVREVFDTHGRSGLQALPGIGAGISSAIAEMLVTGGWGQLARLRGHSEPDTPVRDISEDLPAQPELPAVGTLLDVDREYCEKAAAGRLPTIAPKRLNPGGKAWLPVLHAQRGAWHFTALYSNTERAHELGRTGDWVVIYFYDGDHRERQCTVVTETRGPLAGARVVRGRESECRAASQSRSSASSPRACPTAAWSARPR
jgi:DNA polymerase (family X)